MVKQRDAVGLAPEKQGTACARIDGKVVDSIRGQLRLSPQTQEQWRTRQPGGDQSLNLAMLQQVARLFGPNCCAETSKISALSIRLSRSFPRMWVRIRALAGGIFSYLPPDALEIFNKRHKFILVSLECLLI